MDNKGTSIIMELIFVPSVRLLNRSLGLKVCGAESLLMEVACLNIIL